LQKPRLPLVRFNTSLLHNLPHVLFAEKLASSFIILMYCALTFINYGSYLGIYGDTYDFTDVAI